ncbi:MAG: bifunctional DNA primase/polymerase [Planctomycetota bacterium]|jgi:hypothetical protein
MHYCTDRVLFQWSPGWHAAREYVGLGWRVFPLWGVSNGICTCRLGFRCDRPGKHPRIKNNLRRATTNLKTAWDWWFDWPEANVAVATGQESDVIVLDVDPRNRGDKTMMALCRELGPLPPGPAVCTPADGWHLYFQYPQDEPLKSKAGPGVDVKADGGYVATPPSRTEEGSYRWSVHPSDCPPPPLPPAWLVKITRPKILQFVSPGQKLDTLTWGSGGILRIPSKEYVEQAIRRTLPNTTGTRNDCLKRFLVLLKRHPELAGLRSSRSSHMSRSGIAGRCRRSRTATSTNRPGRRRNRCGPRPIRISRESTGWRSWPSRKSPLTLCKIGPTSRR